MAHILQRVILVLALAAVGQAATWTTPVQAQVASDGLSAQRTRLVQELDLNPAQQKKLDAVLAQTRPKLAALAGLPADQQDLARRKLLGDMHLRINQMLTPDQRAAYELMQARTEERRNAQAKGGDLLAVPAR